MFNPVTSPEYYKINPLDDNLIIKGLFLSWDIDKSPQIVTDTAANILQTVFKDEKPSCIFFRHHIHMYVSPTEQYLGKYVNQVATAFTRHWFLSHYGMLPPDTVCGNILIFGTLNLATQKVDNKDHSIPYETVEEVLRIYDIYQQKC